MLAAAHYTGGIALAQETRAEMIAQQQDDKAERLTPEEPSHGERMFLDVKRRFVDEPNGLYPFVGSVYPGGGLALGGGYRQFYGDHTQWTAKGLWSIRNYKLVLNCVS
jgi:hypothetical protein